VHSQPRPVYRHIVVQRRDLIEKVANPEEFRRLREQIDGNLPIDEDLKHLVVRDTLKKTMRKTFGWAGHSDMDPEGVDEGGLHPDGILSEVEKMKERDPEEVEGATKVYYQRQEGVVVSRIIKEHIPGGKEAMPTQPKVLHHPGFKFADDVQAEYMSAAMHLRKSFEHHCDQQFLLLDEQWRATCTLVTVVVTPIMALPRPDQGVELICEFYQKTRFGYVDTSKFDVFSETGDFPINVPSPGEMMTLMVTADALFPSEQG